MPLFTYFAVVAPALVGLLFYAEAELGPPPPMKLGRGTALALTETKAKVPATVPILTVNESRWIAPDMSAAEAMAQVEPAVESAQNVAKVVTHHKKTAVAREPEPDSRHFYGEYARNDYAEYGRRRDVW